jgi:hypothetical protein
MKVDRAAGREYGTLARTERKKADRFWKAAVYEARKGRAPPSMQKPHLVNIPQIYRLQLETTGVHVQLTFHEVAWRLVSCVKVTLHAAVAGDSIQPRRVRRSRPKVRTVVRARVAVVH